MNILDWKASEDVIKLRLMHCNECEQFNSTLNICNKCFCVMTLKTTIKQSECPLGKWKSIE